MAEVDASLALTGPHGPLTLLEAFEGRRQLIAYYFMWWSGHPAAEQCEGCTFYTTVLMTRASATETSWAGTCPGTQRAPASTRSWLDARSACSTWCYLRDGDRVFETY